ncbi:MAG TPA: class I SAM-dependent methyltransferase [Candidatus Mcinerneyibacterium sp.]|nr:class I SAM-dependent methyltransferase [Candidatus Mcinerneyibacterium sp.]
MENNIYYTDVLMNFVNKFYSSFDEDLEEIVKLAKEREGINPTVDKPVGTLLGFLTRLINPQRILELGTCIGVSTLIFGKYSSENTQIYTIDRRADLLKEATANFERFNLKNDIKPMLGDIKDIVPKLFKENEKFDLIFQDGGKKLYPEMHDYTVRMLNKNGLLISDDVLLEKADFPSHIKGINESLKKYNEMVLNDERLDSIFLPLESGVIVARKINDELG